MPDQRVITAHFSAGYAEMITRRSLDRNL